MNHWSLNVKKNETKSETFIAQHQILSKLIIVEQISPLVVSRWVLCSYHIYIYKPESHTS